MPIFAISDLHMPGAQHKPMDMFGQRWEGHLGKVSHDWRRRVGEDDLVLIPGDISWALKQDEAEGDLHFIGSLPGIKIIVKGNHDYWWTAIGKLRRTLPAGFFALQNDAWHGEVDGRPLAVAGTRGWLCDAASLAEYENMRIYERELIRLELSLSAARKLNPGGRLVAMMHFPPFYDSRETGFTRLFETYGAQCVVYGHVHGEPSSALHERRINGVSYHLVSCDMLGFSLREI